jgi:hypothetical protein
LILNFENRSQAFHSIPQQSVFAVRVYMIFQAQHVLDILLHLLMVNKKILVAHLNTYMNRVFLKVYDLFENTGMGILTGDHICF